MNNSFGRGTGAFLQLLLVAAAVMGIAYYYLKSREQQAKSFSKALQEAAPVTGATTIHQDAKSIESGVQQTLDATSEQYQKQLNKTVDSPE